MSWSFLDCALQQMYLHISQAIGGDGACYCQMLDEMLSNRTLPTNSHHIDC